MSPERPPLEEMTLRQLRRVASEFNVSRYSRMRKEELIAEIRVKMGNMAPTANTSAPAPTTSEVPATPVTPAGAPVTPAPAPAAPVTSAAASVMSPVSDENVQEEVSAAKFEVGQESMSPISLASVDEGLSELPEGYGESRIVLMPRDPQWAYAYWDIPNDHKDELRRQGGSRFALRFYDVTDIDLNAQSPHSLQQYDCDEMAREWFLPIPVSDRDYIAEIGYVSYDGRWLMLARSTPIHIPPVYPSDWVEDHFLTVGWDQDLRGKKIMELVPPEKRQAAAESNELYDHIFAMAESSEAQRVAGSLFGSMHQVPEQAVSSYIFPSGAGMWSVPTASGMGMGSGINEMNMSGAGFLGASASAAPVRPRKFWLVADAELIVYGATEPDATVTIGGKPIKLNPDGTFRFQMSFQDGNIDYPIVAVAADGEQTRSVHMTFDRATPERNTNTKADAVEEWFA